MTGFKNYFSTATHNTYTICMGDFNAICNLWINKLPIKTNSYKDSNIELLQTLNFTDTFRELHPHQKEFSWSKNNSQSRIDLIWISPNLAYSLLEASLINTKT